LIAINLVILLLTGARAPAAYAAVVIGGSLLLAPGSAVTRAHRLVLIAGGLTAIPALLVLGQSYHSVRLLEVLSSNADNLSGRQLLWPMFEAVSVPATSLSRPTVRSLNSFTPGPRTMSICASRWRAGMSAARC
jgi:hypothetical protein